LTTDILRDENFYIEALNKLGKGRNHAVEYHNLITAVLIKLFMPPLDSYKIEKEVDEGRKRIDIFMRNTDTNGFFNRRITHHKIHAPYIMIECKNYEIELKNEQWDQLAGRLNNRRGKFGILTYRKADDETQFLIRCRDFLNDGKYIIALNDNDIESMLKIKLAGEKVDDYMEDKMEMSLWTVLTPLQAIEQLAPIIDSMDMLQGVAESLKGPLHQASDLLTDNNPNNDRAACNQFDQLITQANIRMQNGQLLPDQSGLLTQLAQAIKTSAGCL
jgi:hypothetical protein